ncbi:MAG: YdiU family protein [Planctomycetota bacterium]
MSTLSELNFDNRYTADLPGDPSDENTSRFVANAAYSRVQPKRASKPQLLAWSDEVLDLLDLERNVIERPEFLEVFSGNQQLDGMDPHAMRYGGHQFGHWADQLGDGRAIVLGEVQTKKAGRQTLQLKGAGPTPYSRRADGLAVLRSSVREFLCSEAMHHLGVPTTRALSLVTTGDEVMRDMFYDGHPELEPGAIVCRVAPSFVRFGSFEIAAAHGERDLLERLFDHVCELHFPHLEGTRAEKTAALFAEVVRSTCEMVVEWQRVGFVHGVMNTDNLSIHGVTIDYGPYGWLEDYNPGWTPNTTDRTHHRYAFGNQPGVANWNLAKLGSALAPLLDGSEVGIEPLQAAVDGYAETFQIRYQAMLATKFGLREVEAEDAKLFDRAFELIGAVETDMTIWFRLLSEISADSEPGEDDLLILSEAGYRAEEWEASHRESMVAWLSDYKARLRRENSIDAERRDAMNRANPIYVLRNYLAQLAIDDAAKGDFARLREQLDVLRRPYAVQPGRGQYAEKRPDWARSRPGCSQLSCSS